MRETEESIVPLRHMYAERIIDEDMGAEHEVEAGALEERTARPVTMAAGCDPGRMLGHARRKFDEALKSCRLNGPTRLQPPKRGSNSPASFFYGTPAL